MSRKSLVVIATIAGVLTLSVAVLGAIAVAQSDDEGPAEPSAVAEDVESEEGREAPPDALGGDDRGLICLEVGERFAEDIPRGRLDHGGMGGLPFIPEDLPFDPEDLVLGDLEMEGLLEGLEGMLEDLDFDLEGALEDLDFDLQGMLEDLDFDLEGALEDLDFDLEGMLEGLDLGEIPLGEGFVFEFPFAGEPPSGIPFHIEEYPPGTGHHSEHATVCFLSVGARAEALEQEAADLGAVLEAAGLDVDYETIEIRVPVWNEDAEGVGEILEDFYADRPHRMTRMGVHPRMPWLGVPEDDSAGEG